MKKFATIITLLFIFALGFWSGNSWRNMQYRDSCLDSGGAVDAASGYICRHSPASQP